MLKATVAPSCKVTPMRMRKAGAKRNTASGSLTLCCHYQHVCGDLRAGHPSDLIVRSDSVVALWLKPPMHAIIMQPLTA